MAPVLEVQDRSCRQRDKTVPACPSGNVAICIAQEELGWQDGLGQGHPLADHCGQFPDWDLALLPEEAQQAINVMS